MMDAISYTAVRANLAQTMDKVCDNHEPIIVTRNREQAVVLISLEDYKAMEETAYLLRSPANARRLIESSPLPNSNKVKDKCRSYWIENYVFQSSLGRLLTLAANR